jgi:hypothetical protein
MFLTPSATEALSGCVRGDECEHLFEREFVFEDAEANLLKEASRAVDGSSRAHLSNSRQVITPSLRQPCEVKSAEPESGLR